MPPLVESHPRAVAGALSVGSLGVVFAAALGVIPASAIPRTSPGVIGAIPHVNAVVSLAAVGVIASGWRAIRRGRVRRHRAAMLLGFLLFVVFLVLYLYKVILEGPAAFPGPTVVYRYFYLPLLVGHVGLAMVTLPLLYYVLLLGLTRGPVAIARSPHPKFGRVAAALWLVSFVLGIVVYLLLYVIY